MMESWRSLTLGEICDEAGGTVRTGPFGSQLHDSDYSETGTPVVMPKDIVNGRVSQATVARVNDVHVKRLSQHRLQPGDIVYGRRGDIGRRALVTSVESGWLCGTGCLRIFPGKGVVDPRLLYYALGHPRTVAAIAKKAVGATMPNLNTTILREVRLSFPGFVTQRRIASILGAYDDLIEVNRRRIAVLEEMARRLFEEWFVHFRFPWHAPSADGATSIPFGWQTGQLGDLISLSYGKAMKATDRVPGQVPVIGSSGVVGYHTDALVPRFGIILGRKGNVGSVVWSPVPFFPIDTVFYVESVYPSVYLLQLLRRMPFQSSDAAVPGLNRSGALKLPVTMPPLELVQRFELLVSPMARQVDRLSESQDRLAASRDLILPRLISGDLPITTAERDLEAVA